MKLPLLHYFYLALAIMVTFTSCSIEKRRYMSGYYIEQNYGKHPIHQQELVRENNKKEINTNENSTPVPSIVDTSEVIDLDNSTVSSNSKEIMLLPKKEIKLPFISVVKKENTEPSTLKAPPEQPMPAPVSGLAVAGFVLSLVGLFIFGIPFGVLAIIFGAVALSTIDKNPAKKIKGRGLSIAAIIIGLIDVIAVLFVLTMH